MKLAALDAMWYNLPLEARLKRIAELGFEGVEFWLGSAELGFKVGEEWPATHKPQPLWLSGRKFSRLVEDSGLDTVAMGQYALLGDSPPGGGPTPVDVGRRREARIEDVKALMDFAVAEGARIVISESGGDPAKPEQWEALIEVVNELVSHAEKIGAVLAIENTPQLLVDTDDRLLRLMKEVESDSLRVLFDPANFNLCPPPIDAPAAIRKLKDYIVCLHAKDSVYRGGPYGSIPTGGWDCPPVGKGTVPWRECLKTLKAIGYDGYLIIEYAAPVHAMRPEQTEEGIVEGKKYLDELLAKI